MGRLGRIVVSVSAVAVYACVGDNTSGTDASVNDAATDVAASDVTENDVAAADAGEDAADASAAFHVYATDFGKPNATTGGLYVYNQPLTNGEAPVEVVTANLQNPSDVEFLPGNAQIIVTDPGAKKLFVFNLPILSTSKPVITVSTGTFQGVDGAFDQEGNFWVVGFGNVVERFAPPLTNGSVAAQTFTMPVSDAFGIAINSNDDLVISATGHLYVFDQPIASSTPTPNVDNTALPDVGTGIAFGAAGQFVSVFNSGAVYMFDAGIQNKTPAPVGQSVLAQPARLHVNSAGNLVVADAQKGIVVLTAPAFNTASVTVSPNGDAGVNYRGVLLGP